MSKAVNSPTARLLQSSRLFSLPRPLPIPDLSSSQTSGTFRTSETATAPYPTHQAIATPASSLHRGDWGLKRSLPGKKLRGTKPTVRVRAQDTWEHVTTFESAGDHVRTLEKFGEMGIPMIVNQQEKGGYGPSRQRKQPLSVYDEAYDTTDRGTAKRRGGMGRWKYEGPWLSGMQEGEFKNWLLRQVSARQGEWKEYLRKSETASRVQKEIQTARDQGEQLSAEAIRNLISTKQPTDKELRDLQKELRDEDDRERLTSRLTRLLTDFLDLPMQDEGSQKPDDPLFAATAGSLTNERGPPTTHPGAGISHIRTNAIMDNHPFYGPQASRTPIQARVVRPRTSGGRTTDHKAKLGVGGVVAEDYDSRTLADQDRSRYNRNTHDPAYMLNPETEGGGKKWVLPEAAWVDEHGRLHMSLNRADADSEAVAVKLGNVDAIHERKAVAMEGRSGGSGAPRGTRENANFGTALPRREPTEQGRLRPGVKGFDEEIGRGENVAEIMRRNL